MSCVDGPLRRLERQLEQREQIRQFLGRDLSTPELATFESPEEVSPEVRIVVVAIAKRWRSLAFDYLWERLPEQRISTVLQLVQEFVRDDAAATGRK